MNPRSLTTYAKAYSRLLLVTQISPPPLSQLDVFISVVLTGVDFPFASHVFMLGLIGLRYELSFYGNTWTRSNSTFVISHSLHYSHWVSRMDAFLHRYVCVFEPDHRSLSGALRAPRHSQSWPPNASWIQWMGFIDSLRFYAHLRRIVRLLITLHD